MCLAIPMKIKEIRKEFALVESGRLLRTVNIQMLPGIKPGDYVLVHAGFAITTLDEQAAKETYELLKEAEMLTAEE